MFSRALRGYDRAEVDQFFVAISTLTPEQIRDATFHIRWWGYREEAVDSALDAWQTSQETPSR
jgi:DivIVA domain-containing protein